MPLGFAFEELDAAFGKGNGDFYPLVAQYQVLRLGKKVRNDLQFSQGLVRVSDFRAHKFVCPFAYHRHTRRPFLHCIRYAVQRGYAIKPYHGTLNATKRVALLPEMAAAE